MLSRNFSDHLNLTKIAAVCFMLFIFVITGSFAAGKAETEDKNSSSQQTTGKIPFPKPNSHRGDWLNRHGFSAGLNWKRTGYAESTCLTCHEKNDCVTCHNTRPPADHTSTWRTLSHGFMAEGNRDRCFSCHREDYCVRCHSETEPRSHRGNWRENHCAVCHFSGTLTPEPECAVCHKNADHNNWAPHPINGPLNCSLCHTGGQ